MCKFPARQSVSDHERSVDHLSQYIYPHICIIPYHHNHHLRWMLYIYCVYAFPVPSFFVCTHLIAHIFLVVFVSHSFFVYFNSVHKRDVNLLTWHNHNHHCHRHYHHKRFDKIGRSIPEFVSAGDSTTKRCVHAAKKVWSSSSSSLIVVGLTVAIGPIIKKPHDKHDF